MEPSAINNFPRNEIFSASPDAGLALSALAVKNLRDLQLLIQGPVLSITGFDLILINLTGDAVEPLPYYHYSRNVNVTAGANEDRQAEGLIGKELFAAAARQDYPLVRDTTVAVSLVDESRRFGVVMFGYEENRNFSKSAMDCFKDVALQLSVAIARVSEQEAYAKILRDKALLLKSGNALAAVTGQQSLTAAIGQALSSLFPFNYLLVTWIDRDRNGHCPYFAYPGHSGEEINDIWAFIAASPIPPEDRLLNEVLRSHEPFSYSLEAIANGGDVPPYLDFYIRNRMTRMLGIPITDGHQPVGTALFFSNDNALFTGETIKKLRDIGPQLSASLSRVRNGEQTKRDAAEKAVLHDLGKRLLAVQNNQQFEEALKEGIKKAGLFDEAALVYVKGEQPCAPVIIHQHGQPLFQPFWLVAANVNFTPLDPFFEQLIKQQSVFVAMPDAPEVSGYPEYFSYWKGRGTKKIAAIPVFANRQLAAVLFLFSPFHDAFPETSLWMLGEIGTQTGMVITQLLERDNMARRLESIGSFQKGPEGPPSPQPEDITTAYHHKDIIGADNTMKHVFRLVAQVAASPSSVLLLGETGTGKEMIANAIHQASARKTKPMVKLNCATLPANLIESELFGHERGSFTGAIERRVGKFEQANGGTLFLDEIGELPLDLQVKLLRALQEREVERIGGKEPIKVNVRIISATNKDLLNEVRTGKFRSDLYYRLNVFPITLPPLRDRKNDIPLLAAHFLSKYAKKNNAGPVCFSSKSMKQMMAYNWPGNVRELEHLVERNILLTSGKVIQHVYLPETEEGETEQLLSNRNVKSIDEMERGHILAVLKMTNGKVSGIGGAAEILKIPATTLSSKMRRLKIKKKPQ